jgi:hypothetical protein
MSSCRKPRLSAGGWLACAPYERGWRLAHPLLHLRAAAMVPIALTSNVGGLRLERGLASP